MERPKISNQGIKDAVKDIVDELLGEKKSILLTPRFTDEEKETVEIVVDKEVTILAHASGIRVNGPSTPKNVGLGLKELSSDESRAFKVFKLQDGTEVGRVVNQMDGF